MKLLDHQLSLSHATRAILSLSRDLPTFTLVLGHTPVAMGIMGIWRLFERISLTIWKMSVLGVCYVG